MHSMGQTKTSDKVKFELMLHPTFIIAINDHSDNGKKKQYSNIVNIVG